MLGKKNEEKRCKVRRGKTKDVRKDEERRKVLGKK